MTVDTGPETRFPCHTLVAFLVAHSQTNGGATVVHAPAHGPFPCTVLHGWASSRCTAITAGRVCTAPPPLPPFPPQDQHPPPPPFTWCTSNAAPGPGCSPQRRARGRPPECRSAASPRRPWARSEGTAAADAPLHRRSRPAT